MARDGDGRRGRDAAEMKPRLIPDYVLIPRDDSGGIDYQPYTAQFGDGGFVIQGDKAHLSVSGGTSPALDGDEQLSTGKARNRNDRGERGPASSRREAKAD